VYADGCEGRGMLTCLVDGVVMIVRDAQLELQNRVTATNDACFDMVRVDTPDGSRRRPSTSVYDQQ
jgi:hypothetical protein